MRHRTVYVVILVRPSEREQLARWIAERMRLAQAAGGVGRRVQTERQECN